MPAEVSSNLARFDGLLYGLQGKKDYSLEEWYTNIRGEGFGAEAKRRIMLGNYILSFFQFRQKKLLVKNDTLKSVNPHILFQIV